MTGPRNLQQIAKYVRATWTRPYNKALFMSPEENKDFLPCCESKHGRRQKTIILENS